MAIYIQINKVSESTDECVYEFGPADEIIGSVSVDKSSKELKLLSISRQKASEFYLSRIMMALDGYLSADTYPLHVHYAA
jgi:hypothetical protein